MSQKVYVRGVEETNLAVTIDDARQNNKIFHHNATTLIDPSLLKAAARRPGRRSGRRRTRRPRRLHRVRDGRCRRCPRSRPLGRRLRDGELQHQQQHFRERVLRLRPGRRPCCRDTSIWMIAMRPLFRRLVHRRGRSSPLVSADSEPIAACRPLAPAAFAASLAVLRPPSRHGADHGGTAPRPPSCRRHLRQAASRRRSRR